MDYPKNLDGFFEESVGEVNMDDLAAKVESSILSILQSAHKDVRKHQFRKRAKSIQFPCPICGDSDVDSSKMRGHIYLEYGLYKCYNNNTCSSSLDDFFRRFDMDDLFSNAEIQQLQKVAANSRSAVYSARQAVTFTEIDDIAPYLFDKQEIINIYNAVELDKDSYARGKIASRKIPAYKNEFLLWQPDSQALLILNMHSQSQKVMNVVKRQMKSGFRGPKYLTASYSEILSIKHGLRTAFKTPEEPIPLVDIAEKAGFPEEILTKLDITGQYFNVMNVDWGEEIYVFEGPIDSFFMPNSLAFGGTGVGLSHPTLKYVFDDDEPGRKEAFKRLDNKQPVFMWKRFLRENPIYKKPYVTKRDFNEMYCIQPFSPRMMMEYFTDNPLNKLEV